MSEIREFGYRVSGEGNSILPAVTHSPVEGTSHTRAGDSIDAEFAELLHALNNVLAGTLLNAQVVEWKLPSYSRLKRNLHEIERNAQRGGELVKRLLCLLASSGQADVTSRQAFTELSASPDNSAAEPDESAVAEVTGAEMVYGATACSCKHLENGRKLMPHTPV